MALSRQSESFTPRLIKQLHGFSELEENLTIRVLDLEERLETLERSISSRLDPLKQEKLQDLLEESEERIQILKNLLQKQEDISESILENKIKNQNIQNDHPCDQIPIEDDLLSENNYEEEQDFSDNQSEVWSEDNTLSETEYIDDPQMPLMPT